MRVRTTLLTQVLAVNTALVAVTALVAAIVAHDRPADATTDRGLLLVALAVATAVLLNSLLLRRRLDPVKRLVETMAEVDLHAPGRRAPVPARAALELQTLTAGFNRMLDRLQEERRQAGRLVLRAQERERGRIASDLHDEVNQALTAILLRLEATLGDAPPGLRPELQETKQLVNQAMEELLAIARHLRPTALDDHGLVAALASQVDDFGRRTRLAATFTCTGEERELSDEEQLVVYRVTQESLSNVVQHARARCASVTLRFTEGRGVQLRVRDDGRGFDPEQAFACRDSRRSGRPGGLGLSGMRERALLAGGRLAVFSWPGDGTIIELNLGDRPS